MEGLPKINSRPDKICKPCAKGKHVKSSFKSKTIVTTSKPLELLHMDLFGPMRTTSLGGKNFGFVIVDDYSRFTWVSFLEHKDDTFESFVSFSKKVQKDKKYSIISIRSDHGGEFQNESFAKFWDS